MTIQHDAPDPRSTGYDPNPHYLPVGGPVGRGWAAAVATLAAPEDGQPLVLAIDGPGCLDWGRVGNAVRGELELGRAGWTSVELHDLREAFRPWAEVEAMTRSPLLGDDPDFEMLADGRLVDLLDRSCLPARPTCAGVVQVVFGPGAAAVDPDVLWWADLPKRYAEAAVTAGRGRNLAAPAEVPATTKRLFYIDWPLQDRHRDEHAAGIDLWIDLQDRTHPTWLTGEVLRATCVWLGRRPHRTRPTFNSTPWGGQWARSTLGHNPDAPNSALGYELIAPESGVLIGADPRDAVEVPFQLVVSHDPTGVLGPEIHRRFGTSFPIRFDYLDTVAGANLSVHCHPQPDYMREVFGWTYTQHETYYVMVGAESNTIFLGLRDAASVDAFHEAAHRADSDAHPFDITKFVQTFPATPHQLFLVPAGTPHGSGEGNVVLEVSATPYLYSLRFYDWLRRDYAQRQRPVHVEHAFRNLTTERVGAAVGEELVQRPRTVRRGEGWREDLLGHLPEMFFEVLRLELEPDAEAALDTGGRFHVLAVVDGDGVVLETEDREHILNYAETIAVPAAVGRYNVRSRGTRPVRVVKANVT